MDRILTKAAFFFIIGFFTYLFFQPNIIFLKSYLFRPILKFNNRHLNLIFTGYLADILYYISLNYIIIYFKKKSFPFVYILIMIFLPIASEFAQLYNYLDGTFDFVDLLIYFFIFLTFQLNNNY